MKKALALLFLLAFPGLIQGATLPFENHMVDFRAGAEPNYLPDKLDANAVQDSLNVQYDQKRGITRRGGLTAETACLNVSTLSTTGQWSFLDTSNTEWLIRLDENGILRATDVGSCATILVSSKTLSTTLRSDADSGLGRFWITNPQDGLMSWQGTSSGTYKFHAGTAPYAAQVEIFKNRVVLAGISNEQSSVRLSGLLNGEDWIENVDFSTSPFTTPVGGRNDGKKIYGILSGVNELLIAKGSSLWALYGENQFDFSVRNISNDIGCIFPYTMSSNGITVKFLSNRGIDSYTYPTTITRISDPVQNLVAPLISVGDRTRSRNVDSQTEWEQGFSNPNGNISTTFLPGSIRVLNQFVQDTLSADFAQGSFDPIRFSTINDQVSLSTAVIAFENWDDGDFTVSPGWSDGSQPTEPVSFFSVVSSSLQISGGGGAGCSNILHCETLYTTCSLNAAIYGFGFQFVVGAASAFSFDISGESPNAFGILSNAYFLTLHSTGSVILNKAVGTMPTMIASATVTTFSNTPHSVLINKYSGGEINVRVDGALVISAIDKEFNGSGYIGFGPSNPFAPSGDKVFISSVVVRTGVPAVYTSRTFNAQTTNYVWQDFVASSFNFTNGRIGLQVSTDGAIWSSTVALANPIKIATSTYQYFRYVSTFAMNPIDTGFSSPPAIMDASIGVTSTGFYQLTPFSVGNDITSWGLFTADTVLNGGTITFKVQSATGTEAFTEAGWLTQSLNTDIVAPVNPVLGIRVEFKADFSTNTPRANNLTANWNEGELPPTPWAITYQDRWHLFFSSAVGSTARNDIAQIYDRNHAFAQQRLYAGAGTIWKNKLTIGDSRQTGKIYTVETSTRGNDDGTRIESYVKFRRVDGDCPDCTKFFDKVYLTISRSAMDTAGSQIFRLDYTIDDSTVTYMAGYVEISTGTTLVNQKIDFPNGDPAIVTQGRYLDLTLTEVSDSKGYSIHKVSVYGKRKDPD